MIPWIWPLRTWGMPPSQCETMQARWGQTAPLGFEDEDLSRLTSRAGPCCGLLHSCFPRPGLICMASTMTNAQSAHTSAVAVLVVTGSSGCETSHRYVLGARALTPLGYLALLSPAWLTTQAVSCTPAARDCFSCSQALTVPDCRCHSRRAGGRNKLPKSSRDRG